LSRLVWTTIVNPAILAGLTLLGNVDIVRVEEALLAVAAICDLNVLLLRMQEVY
jgi:hypothetical protein